MLHGALISGQSTIAGFSGDFGWGIGGLVVDDDDCADYAGIRAVYAMKLSRNLKEAQRSAA